MTRWPLPLKHLRIAIPLIYGLTIAATLLHAADTPALQTTTWTYEPAATTSNQSPCPSPATCQIWRQFRASHPWPYQTFALQQQPNTNEAVIIISEPPPTLSRDQLAQVLRKIFGDSFLEFNYDRWATGVDGWLEDVVLRVRTNPDQPTTTVLSGELQTWQAPADIVDRLRLLHLILQKTSDGFWLDRIDSSSSSDANAVPIAELKIPVSDVAGWLAEDKRVWTSIATGSVIKRTTRELYAEKTPGVFRCEHGMVALVAPANVKLDNLAPQFRRFAVASDLILGASGLNKGGLLLLGRLRQLPLATLPPLRFESLASFARNKTQHLAQSYERQRIFAGRIQSGKYAGWDWAPILLSQQLDDSEFGTLLNLADQILKSWSEHGRVEYYAFAYPKPDKYPFEPGPASDYFRDKYLTASLLFNWNTEGVATITTVNGKEILTGDRTGALHILYRPSNSLLEELGTARVDFRAMQKDADERATHARDYFATRGDPILVRVLQNVLLFQAAQSFLTIADPQDPTRLSRSDQVASVLQKQASLWLSQINRGDSDVERSISANLKQFMRTSGYSTDKMAQVLASPQSVERDLQRAYEKYRSTQSDALWMPGYLQKSAQHAHELFESTCNSVGGHIEKTPAGNKCNWKTTGPFDTAPEVFASYDAYTQGLKKMENDFIASLNRIQEQRDEVAALWDTYAKASEIAQKLSARAGGVDLDDVLRKVLESTAASATTGSIRTPSVVLSKNSVDVESIGGHNIDLIPPRRVVEPNFEISKVSTPGPHSIPQIGELPPPRPEIATLKVERSGTLLSEMRPLANDTDTASPRFATLQAKAKTCQCEAIVTQGEDGVIYYTRNAPPPYTGPLFGKTAVIDALATPPPVHIVRFEGFSGDTVENLSRSTALLTDTSHQGSFNKALDSLNGLFGRSSVTTSRSEVTITVTRDGQAPEILRIGENSGTLAALREPMEWRTAGVSEATPQKFAELFGNEAVLHDGATTGVVVEFARKEAGSQRLLGITVDSATAQRPGFWARLRAVVSQWLRSQPAQPRPWAESLVDLRQTIKRELSPADLRFYYQNNQRRIRVAKLFTRPRTEG